MRRTVPNWLTVMLVLLVIAILVGIFMFGGRRQEQKMPEGFKPTPPRFKEAPVQRR